MRKLLSVLTLILLSVFLSGCSSGEAAARRTAKELIEASNNYEARIIRVVEGDPAVRDAGDLYCVETDAINPVSGLPFLLVVWRIDDTWEGAVMSEGYYEWDLQGCPR